MSISETAATARALVQRFDTVTTSIFDGTGTVAGAQDELESIIGGASKVRAELGPLAPDGVESLLAIEPWDASQLAGRAATGGASKTGNGDLGAFWKLRAGMASMQSAAAAAAQLGVEPGSAAAAGGLQAVEGAARLYVQGLVTDGVRQLGRADDVLSTYRMPSMFLGKGAREEFVGGQKARVQSHASAIVEGVSSELSHLLPTDEGLALRNASTKVTYGFIYSGDVLNLARKVQVAGMRTAIQAARTALQDVPASALKETATSARRLLGGEVRQAAAVVARELADASGADARAAILADPAAAPDAVAAAMRTNVAIADELARAASALESGITDRNVIDAASRARQQALALVNQVQASPHAIVLPESTQVELSTAQQRSGIIAMNESLARLPGMFASVDVAAGPPRMVADVLAIAKVADTQLAASATASAKLDDRVAVDKLRSRVRDVTAVLRKHEDTFWQVERVRGQRARPGVHESVTALQAARLRTELARQVAHAAETLLPTDAWRLPGDTLHATFAARSSLRSLAATLAPFGDNRAMPKFEDAIDAMARAAGGMQELQAQLATPGAMDLVALDARAGAASAAITAALDHLQSASSIGEDYQAVGKALPDYGAGIANAQAVVEQLDGVVPEAMLQPIRDRIDGFSRQVSAAENAVTAGYGRVLSENLYPRRGDAAFIEQDLQVLNDLLRSGDAGPGTI